MRLLTLALAGTLVAATALGATAAPAQSSLAPKMHGSPNVSPIPGPSLSGVHIRRAPRISPHVGLPGISGLGTRQISPHVGLPGISGFPDPTDSRRHHGGHHDGHHCGHHDGHHCGHHDGHDFDFGLWGYYGDGDGYVDAIPYADEFGFFGSGGYVTMDGDRPVYHYDRSYPYEFGGMRRTTAPRAAAGLNCQVNTVWDSEARKDVPVRVCRAY